MGAVSLFNLCHDYFLFGIRPLARQILQVYQTFFHPIAALIQLALGRLALLFVLRMPELNKDFIILYIFTTACLTRAFHIWRYYDAKSLSFERKRLIGFEVRTHEYFSAYTCFALAALWPLTFLYLLAGLARARYVESTIAKATTKEVGYAFGVFLFLFATSYTG